MPLGQRVQEFAKQQPTELDSLAWIMKTKHHYYVQEQIKCAGDGKEHVGPSFLYNAKKYCMKHYLKFFRNPNVEVIERTYAKKSN